MRSKQFFFISSSILNTVEPPNNVILRGIFFIQLLHFSISTVLILFVFLSFLSSCCNIDEQTPLNCPIPWNCANLCRFPNIDAIFLNLIFIKIICDSLDFLFHRKWNAFIIRIWLFQELFTEKQCNVMSAFIEWFWQLKAIINNSLIVHIRKKLLDPLFNSIKLFCDYKNWIIVLINRTFSEGNSSEI